MQHYVSFFEVFNVTTPSYVMGFLLIDMCLWPKQEMGVNGLKRNTSGFSALLLISFVYHSETLCICGEKIYITNSKRTADRYAILDPVTCPG